MQMLKNYWKELLLVAIISAILGLVVDIVPDLVIPADAITQGMGSPAIMFIGIVILVALFLVPVISGAIGGYLISKRTKEIIPAAALPAAGAAIGAVILIMIPMLVLLTLNDAGWQARLDKTKEAVGEGMNLFSGMGVEEFKAFTIGSLGIGLVFMAAINLSFGLLGALLGRWLVFRSS